MLVEAETRKEIKGDLVSPLHQDAKYLIWWQRNWKKLNLSSLTKMLSKGNVIIQLVCIEHDLRRLKLDLICDKFSKQNRGDLLYMNDKSFLEMLT